jgi:hypothetical protein
MISSETAWSSSQPSALSTTAPLSDTTHCAGGAILKSPPLLGAHATKIIGAKPNKNPHLIIAPSRHSTQYRAFTAIP